MAIRAVIGVGLCSSGTKKGNRRELTHLATSDKDLVVDPSALTRPEDMGFTFA